MEEFESSWQEFSQSGNFLELTRQFEQSIPTNKNVVLDNSVSIKLIETGILQIEPVDTAETSLLISSGIHGNETAPIEIVNQIAKDIVSGKLEVKARLMLIIGNPPSMNISKRFSSQNLNRLFDGRYKDSQSRDYETERAKVIEQAVAIFFGEDEHQSTSRYHFDLHTAIRPSQYEKFVVYPYLDGRPWDKNHIAFFGGSDITTVLLGHQPAGTFSYYTSHQFNAHSATVELGKVRPFGQNNMDNFSDIVKNLNRLIQGKPTKQVKFDNDIYKVFQVKQEIIKENEEYNLLLADDVKNFTAFKKGTILASDQQGSQFEVENDGEAIVFPNNNVPVGQRMGVLLEEVQL